MNLDSLQRNKIYEENPYSNANIFSRIFFCWVTPIIKLGNERTLQLNDLYKVIPEDESEILGLQLEREWLKEVETCRGTNKKPSFVRTLFKMFGQSYILPSILCFLDNCIVNVGQPFCLSLLVTFFDKDSRITIENAFLYATGVVLGSVYIAFSIHFSCFIAQRIGMRVRVATSSLIHRKSLRLSQKSLGETTTGQIMNMIANDVSRFDQLFNFIKFLWAGPLSIIIMTTVLYYTIGIGSLSGVAFMFFFLPMQHKLGNLLKRLRQEVSQQTDKRLRIINEIIPAIRVIKMYAWEEPFIKLTEQYRKIEMKLIRRISYLRAINITFGYISGKLMIFPTLIAMVLSGNELTASKAFLVVALFNNVRLVMPQGFNHGIQFLVDGLVAIKRIEDFLQLDEIKTYTKAFLENANEQTISQQVDIPRKMIAFHNVSVKWPVTSAGNEENTLKDISFQILPGQFLSVIGQVGCGKSTLLNVILGELPILDGQRLVEGKISYCSQNPWIISGTIRENILCGSEMIYPRYEKVINAVALWNDFDKLPHGDCTIIGDGGVSLSGGQKMRVNLARCLYIDADLYLLDDPLSALDNHVAAHVFENVINTFLHGKIRILVTHHLEYHKSNDRIILLDSGRIEFNGTYEEMKNLKINLFKSVQNGRNNDVIKEKDEAEWKNSKYSNENSRIQTSSSFLENKKIIKKERLVGEETPIRLSFDTKNGNAEMVTPKPHKVTAGTYWKYVRAGGSLWSFSLFVFSCFTAEILFFGSDYWLNMWTIAERTRWAQQNQTNQALNVYNISTSRSNHSMLEEGYSTEFYNDRVMDTKMGVSVYSILIFGVLIFGYLRASQFYIICTGSSEALHNKMLRAVIGAPVQFFDRNTVGCIVNRFSKDTGSMDDSLPPVLFDPIWIVLNTLGAVLVAAVVKYWLIIPPIILGFLFYYTLKLYLNTAMGIKELETSTKSPVFTQMHSSLIGLTTIRAHGCQTAFQRDFDHYQDIHSSAWFLLLATGRWLGVWMDLILIIYIACVTYGCLLFRESLSSGEVGLIVSAATGLGLFQVGIRQSAELVNQMTSVHRIIDYGNIIPEAPPESSKVTKPPLNWPNFGKIQFEKVSLKYNPNNPPVLENLNLTIKPREKVGICGRTGAGKSSIIAAIFRLTEPDGMILIDDIDSKLVNLHDLRSKMSIIPQEPTLFSGSLRFNLDPFGKIADDTLWAAMNDVHLSKIMAVEFGSVQNPLDFVLSEGGVNTSVGQKQLICLARAILQCNRIVILDEATASIDKETDKLIQSIIRDKFRDCTVLTIAHRLNTIIDSDKILVLDSGKLKEFDEPKNLLSNPLGLFRSLEY